jgi:rhodanese-related sulfurtransferase
MSIDTPESPPQRRTGAASTAGKRWAAVGTGVVIAVALIWFALGMPGRGQDDDATSPDGAMSQDGVVTLTPGAFADRMSDPEAVVINVHVPYEGEIDGTDELIPFDEIRGDARLPVDKNAEILLYCMSGNMSETAARTLEDEGYTDVAHLGGGMQDWSASGREIVHRDG